MIQEVYTFSLNMQWELINAISKIDRFDASWNSIEKREGRSLKQLKSIATVRSVGASTRIEGSAMSDEEVGRLIEQLDTSRLNERDEQEVAGYFTTLDLIADAYPEIGVSETPLKSLHKTLLQFSGDDEWHRGQYKQRSNQVQAHTPDGRAYTIFETAPPGIPTETGMRNLINWYDKEKQVHPLVKIALFCYDFLSIHPFQDGNGRMSRLLATLLLLKQGYTWIQYISFEHEIEARKGDYYRRLMDCQKDRPGENVTGWVLFFLDCLSNIQHGLMQKLALKNTSTDLSIKEKEVIFFVEKNAGTSSGKISERLRIPLPTVKKMLAALVSKGLLEKRGTGAGTNYSAF